MSQNTTLESLLFEGDLATVDPLISDLIALEEERQARRIIMIPSESISSTAVRRALDSVFTNLYAEGYPSNISLGQTEDELADLPRQMAQYRRYQDRRFYKGNDYVNIVESLARRRIAECFATPEYPAETIFANVQPLSGAAANMAVYEALAKRGDVVMGMDLMQGGHLSHGSRFHMSGKHYDIVSYGIDPATGRLDYGEIRRIALKHHPKFVIAGFTSYPWAPDWAKFRAICDEAGAYLFADISHPAGMTIAGAYPTPIGYADVITFTTHKTLCGPRAAVILTTTPELARMVDMAVFPGEQGGPHLNTIAAMAVAFKIAQSEQFRKLQFRIVENARHLADCLVKEGIGVAYGGTDTHLLLIDLRTLPKRNGMQLKGEPAVRILELAGIVANKNTIPGDTATPQATGIRLGTPWITQRGAGLAEMEELARIIKLVLTDIDPFEYQAVRSILPRGKIGWKTLQEARQRVDALTRRLDPQPPRRSGYPHHMVDLPANDAPLYVSVTGERADAFLENLLTADLGALEEGKHAVSLMLDEQGRIIDQVAVARLGRRCGCRNTGYVVRINAANAAVALPWMQGHADGYLRFEPTDVAMKVEGPAIVEALPATSPAVLLFKDAPATDAALAGTAPTAAHVGMIAIGKPYFVGQLTVQGLFPAPVEQVRFTWQEPANPPLLRTRLFDEHKRLGARMAPFAGHEMPLWYGGSTAADEHKAVREKAGLFDVSHMGSLEVTGPFACDFLDVVCTHYIRGLKVGQSCYTYLMGPDSRLWDDLMVYRFGKERYLVVVNAANADKDWAWLNFVNDGLGLIDEQVPARRVLHKAVLRDLKDPAWGADQRVDIALQGPASIEVLKLLAGSPEEARVLGRLQRTECATVNLAGSVVDVARTGYTGESMGFELFVHPDHVATLWKAILETGAPLGVVPAGLAARDSTRTEAGLPLYGHELEGHFAISPAGAGFAGYVKLHKPFFIGRRAYMAGEAKRDRVVVRFKVTEDGGKPVRHGDFVFSPRGVYIGQVLSAAFNEVGVQIGLAYVQTKAADQGPIVIFPKAAGDKPTVLDFDALKPGQRGIVPTPAQIIPRFMMRNAAGARISGEVDKAEE